MNVSGNALKSVLAAFCVAAIALTLLAKAPTPTSISYNKVVRPALESALCVEAQEFQGKTFYIPATEGCGTVEALSATQSAMAKEMIAVLSRYPVLCNRLFSQAQATVPEGNDKQQKLQQKYRALVLSDSVLIQALMPNLGEYCKKKGLLCADCPGLSEQQPIKTITIESLLPYTYAFLWPSHYAPPRKIAFQICVGINGLDRLANPDPLLEEAAFACINGNGEVMGLAAKDLGNAIDEEGFKKLSGEAEQLDYLRDHLAKALSSNPQYLNAIKERADQVLPLYGLALTKVVTK